MRLLITNDDGVDAPGILTLAPHRAKAGHEVLVSALPPNKALPATG